MVTPLCMCLYCTLFFDVVLQTQGVEAVFKDPPDPEHLPGSLLPPQVMRPQHHAHRSKVPGVGGGQEVMAAERPCWGAGGPCKPSRFCRKPPPWAGPTPLAPGPRCVRARRHSQAVQTMRCRQHEVARDEGGAAEVASAQLQRSYEGPGVRPGCPAPHDLRGQRGAWGHGLRPGAQGASRAAPGKSGLHARGEGERVLALALNCTTVVFRELCRPVNFNHRDLGWLFPVSL